MPGKLIVALQMLWAPALAAGVVAFLMLKPDGDLSFEESPQAWVLGSCPAGFDRDGRGYTKADDGSAETWLECSRDDLHRRASVFSFRTPTNASSHMAREKRELDRLGATPNRDVPAAPDVDDSFRRDIRATALECDQLPKACGLQDLIYVRMGRMVVVVTAWANGEPGHPMYADYAVGDLDWGGTERWLDRLVGRLN